MKSKISHVHHYIPKFYLDGFTEDGFFFVYDIKKDLIKKGTYAPKSHYFEMDRNTIIIDGKQDSKLEELSSDRDTRLSEVFDFLKKNEQPVSLSAYQYFQIQFFLLHLNWEIPVSDSIYKNKIEGRQLSDFHFKVVDNAGNDLTSIEGPMIMNQEITKRYLRGYLGTVEWLKSDSKRELEKYRVIFNPAGDNFISDNPIIRKDESVEILDGEFIAPLTKFHTLVRTHRPITATSIAPEFSVLQRLIILKQSIKYTSCCKKEILENLIQLSKKFQLKNLKTALFDCLNRH